MSEAEKLLALEIGRVEPVVLFGAHHEVEPSDELREVLRRQRMDYPEAEKMVLVPENR